jgi:sialate O-acetylesterase
MIAPLKGLKIRGVLWYQGESNLHDSSYYRAYLDQFLAGWRRWFDSPGLPVVAFQLPLFGPEESGCKESSWAALRQAQLFFLEQSHTALATALSAGEWNDLHPLAKKEVGKRLAAEALRLTGQEVPTPESPRYKKAERRENQLILHFQPETTCFSTADKQPPGHLFGWNGTEWIPLQAECHHNQLILKIAGGKISHVRYGWADNPRGANLQYGPDLAMYTFELSL